MRLAIHIACKVEMNAYTILVENSEGKKLYGRPRMWVPVKPHRASLGCEWRKLLSDMEGSLKYAE